MEYLTEDVAHIAPLGKAPAGRRAGMSVDQEKLASRIERLIRRRTNDKVRELRVEVRGDGIMLKGRCGTYYCKQLAQHAAMSLSTSGPVTNQIEVW